MKIKKFRTREKSFLIEGKKNVLELLNSSFEIRYLLATSDFIKDNNIALSNVGNILYEVSPAELQSLGTFTTNNDCMAVGAIREYGLEDLSKSDHIFALDGLSDPGNLGTIIRTLDWFGYRQLVCSPTTAEFYNPKVLNATMGSFSRIKVVYMDLDRLIASSDMSAYGADLHGIKLGDWRPAEPSIIVMGSESHGLDPELHSVLTDRVSIPRYGEAESLNVAIATGIICNHLRS